jgi:hypothetical protein
MATLVGTLTKHEQQPHEESPLGLILCSEKSHQRIELMELGKSNIRVAEYLTVLPPRELLAKKLHEAIHSSTGADASGVATTSIGVNDFGLNGRRSTFITV